MSHRTCEGCPTIFAVGANEHHPRKWCSEACRVWCHRHPGETRPVDRLCEHCKAPLTGRRAMVRFCAPRCQELAAGDRKRVFPRPALCVWCATLYEQRRDIHRTCCLPCARKLYRFENPEKYPSWNEAKKAGWQRRRALKMAVPTERVVATAIYERDRWICQICGTRVDPDLAYPHQMSASLDHRIPLSKGGSHTADNIQLAHLACNVRKSATMPDGVAA